MREDVCRTFFLNRTAGFLAVKETDFFTFYELDVEEKVIFEKSLGRKLRLETGISTVFSGFEAATPAPRKLRIGAGKFLDKLLCMDQMYVVVLCVNLCCCCCCCCFLTLTDPLRIQLWSQNRRNQTKSNRESEMSMKSRQKRTAKK